MQKEKKIQNNKKNPHKEIQNKIKNIKKNPKKS